MQKVFIDDVGNGAIIAKDIYNSEGIMLISKGTVYKDGLFEHLEVNGVQEVFIEDDAQEKVEIIEDARKNMYIDDIIYQNTRLQAQKHIQKIMLRFGAMGSVSLDRIHKVVEDIIEQLLSKKDIVLTLSRLRSIDNYTYEHSVNVSVLSLIVGIDMNLDKDSLRALGTGAILHDIGKVGISEDILKKPFKLTQDEYAQIQKHTEYGYEILTRSNVSEEAAAIALHHHEKYDGTGYNRKMKGRNIPLFSRIVSVVDVYDAMSNDRVYKKKLPPDKVYKEISRLGNKHFDAEIMGKFVQHLSLYPVGTGVVLNTNHKGIVVAQNKWLPESPVVRLFKKNKASAGFDCVDIDLSTTRHLYIKETF